MICVLEIIDGPARGKRVWFRENQCIEIGRISTADVAIPSDSRMSRHHLLLDSTKNEFRVRDIGSTNGTYLNDIRVLVHSLCSGDMIRAGASTFLISLRNDGENPHEGDGVSFSKTITDLESVVAGELDVDQPCPTMGTPRTIDFGEDGTLESTVRIQRQVVSPISHALVASDPWWVPPFQRTSVPYIYIRPNKNSLDDQEFVELARRLAHGCQFGIVVNHSIVEQDRRDMFHAMCKSLKVERLSKTLGFAHGSDSDKFWEIVSAGLGSDAIIFLASRTPIAVDKLVPHANSLSFPSMFDAHLNDSKSDIGDRIVQLGYIALFESKRCSGFGLVMPPSVIPPSTDV